jgi:ankyrin repeat protein
MNPNEKDIYELNALFLAAKYGHLYIVKYLIHECGMNPNEKDIYELNALHLASIFGRLEIVKYLIHECGMDPKVKDKYGRTALHFASIYDCLEILFYFISVGCDILKDIKLSNKFYTKLVLRSLGLINIEN